MHLIARVQTGRLPPNLPWAAYLSAQITMGRAVLVNSVLDSQLVYAMSALSIPVAVLHKMDRLRRSFLCNGDN